MLPRLFLVTLALLVANSCSAPEGQEASAGSASHQAPPLGPLITPMQLENDRVCKKAYGLECHAIPHLLGPLNAEALGEDRACIREGIAKKVNGEWVQDNKYQNPETGERYGDGCIVISL